VLGLQRADRAHRLAFVPYQLLSEPALRALGLTRAACARAVQLVDERGCAASGARAVNGALARLDPRWDALVRAMEAAPPLLALEALAYRAVAALREPISMLLGTARFAALPREPQTRR